MRSTTNRAACDAEEAFANVGNSPFGPAGGLDHRRHAVSVQALGLGEVDHIEDDSLKEEAEETRKKHLALCVHMEKPQTESQLNLEPSPLMQGHFEELARLTHQ